MAGYVWLEKPNQPGSTDGIVPRGCVAQPPGEQGGVHEDRGLISL